MTKLMKYMTATVLVLTLFWIGTLLADKQSLSNEMIRLHVVADSDSQEDQRIKLAVRDSVLAYMSNNMKNLSDVQEAKNYVVNHLDELKKVADDTLVEMGSGDRAHVFLTKEEFGVREYDTFTLPSGIYESLRIEIGEAKGKNWWCVVFPSLCISATKEGFAETAVSAGFNQGLVNTLTESNGYEIRFFFLDCLGKIENFFSFS